MIPIKNKMRIKLLGILLFIFCLSAIFLRWESDYADNYIDKADHKSANGDYNGALRDYYYAENLNKQKDILYHAKIRRGEIFMKFGKYSEADQELMEALKVEKTRYDAYEILGDLYYKKQDFDRAINFYNDAIQYSDGTETLLDVGVKRAKTFISKGEMKLAKHIMEELYSEMHGKNSSKELLFYLGILEFDESLSSNEYLDELGSSDEYKWKVEEIKSFIEKYDDKHSDGYSDIILASLYNSIQEPYLAINKAKEAIGLNSSYRDAWIVLGQAHFIQKDYISSLDDLTNALRLDGHNKETYFWLGSVFRKIGNEKLASEYFKKYEIFK